MADWNDIYSSGTINWGVETMPPMISKQQKYPFECPTITSDFAKTLVNTKMDIQVFSYFSDGNIESFTIELNCEDGNCKNKYVLLSLDLLEQSNLIAYDEENKILSFGYIDCEIVGFIPMPYKAYLLRILE